MSRVAVKKIPVPGFDLNAVPLLQVSAEQLSELPLDETATRLVALVDGQSSFGKILKKLGVPEAEAFPLCRRLLTRGILSFVGTHHTD